MVKHSLSNVKRPRPDAFLPLPHVKLKSAEANRIFIYNQNQNIMHYLSDRKHMNILTSSHVVHLVLIEATRCVADHVT